MGKIWLVGAGPGDPDLLTVKAVKTIELADVILYDRLINQDILQYAKPDAELIFCGKLPKHYFVQQDTINFLLVQHAMQGKQVVRLKGGDPFIFGRGGEEAAFAVKHHIPFEVVPGITSGIAAPAYAGIPVTHRDYSASFAIVTGHRKEGAEEEDKWEALAKGIDTLAVYMGVSNLPYIAEQLIRHGKNPDTPVAFIHWGTTETQNTVTATLQTMTETAHREDVRNPSMIIIGEVVRLRDELQWFEESAEERRLHEAIV
ncbi:MULTISPECIES: uroporphyrinogen-III C-methyltransferase [unclassified Sporosarcina]|uniref:uroporphyrinogen-III C-methyltransferase n=1 Tax=unclassified Sporosarcina TaxID=2647733 RepID=UPI00203C5169|nr:MULTISPECIES: uroporphyrinogen-III C-methyltransferase [unclassified Sporosarcina]GKV65045.1 uroporphyrin-III C-methyltransferase [Sporosarcina sp. NCCP-2331]GLB56914.1 uroporphyrin-III C-methyltransferase [Sporosarcina sp. NCCP-2378]